jgi:hypothetical protein
LPAIHVKEKKVTDREQYSEPIQEVDAWLAQFRRFWSALIDALERHLDGMGKDPSTPAKRKSRRAK